MSNREGQGSKAGTDGASRGSDDSNPAASRGDLRHQLVFEASTEGLLLATSDGSILDANPEACRILQRTREEITSAGLDAFFDATDPRLELVREEQRNAGRFKGELRLLRGDGMAFPAEVSVACCGDESGEEHLGIGFRDVGGRERSRSASREDEGFYRALVENVLDVVVVVGADGTMRYASPSVERIMGYKPEEFVGMTAFEHAHPEDLGPAMTTFSEAARNPGVTEVPVTIRLRHKDGSWRHMEG